VGHARSKPLAGGLIGPGTAVRRWREAVSEGAATRDRSWAGSQSPARSGQVTTGAGD
jgi:hypothetical protein